MQATFYQSMPKQSPTKAISPSIVSPNFEGTPWAKTNVSTGPVVAEAPLTDQPFLDPWDNPNVKKAQAAPRIVKSETLKKNTDSSQSKSKSTNSGHVILQLTQRPRNQP
jgi:hypothetical protein